MDHVTGAALLVLLGVGRKADSMSPVPMALFLASVAVLAPLLSNLTLRSRSIALLSGPLFVCSAVVLQTTDPEAICWLAIIIPACIFCTAPAWVLSWMITDRWRIRKPDASGEQDDGQISSESALSDELSS